MRIVVRHPVAGVIYAIQRGRTEIEFATRAMGADIAFEVPIRVASLKGTQPRLLGDFVQGPPAARFVYVNTGTCAGQLDSCWTRRAKVPLRDLPFELIERTRVDLPFILQASIAGTAKDGGPACASVPLLAGGWTEVT